MRIFYCRVQFANWVDLALGEKGCLNVSCKVFLNKGEGVK